MAKSRRSVKISRTEHTHVFFPADCYTTRVCKLRAGQPRIGPRSARNTPLGFKHAPQAQAEPGEMRRQKTRVVQSARRCERGRCGVLLRVPSLC
jgi:hypothetical protein